MRAVRIQNPVLNSYLTDISTDYSSGTALSVRSTNSFSNNDLIVVGNPGEELTEEKKITIIGSIILFNLVSALSFQHNKGTPIYKALWDFASIEANYGAGWVVISTSPIQWDNQDNLTIYLDSNGTDTTQYRFRFNNSVTSLYSEYSPTLLGIGFTKFQMGYIIKEARRIAGDKAGKIMTTEECLRTLTRGKNIIRGHNGRYWFWKVDGFQSNKSIVGTAGNSVYDLAAITDLGTINYIEYRYALGSMDNKWVLDPKPDIDFLRFTRDLNRPTNDFPHSYRLLPPDASSTKGYFEVEYKLQNSSVGTFYISYYKEEPDYNSVDDLTAVIMPEILQDYLIAQLYATKGNDAMRDKYMKHFTGPENREKTLALEDLEGIALLDELDRQYKRTQGKPMSLWRFKGQKALRTLYGSRMQTNPDYIKENYFNGPE